MGPTTSVTDSENPILQGKSERLMVEKGQKNGVKQPQKLQNFTMQNCHQHNKLEIFTLVKIYLKIKQSFFLQKSRYFFQISDLKNPYKKIT